MAFTLEVEFTGLCMYLVQQDRKEVGIVMPDARQNGRDQTGRPVAPPDFEKFDDYLVPHVGYLRYNFADLAPTSAQSGKPTQSSEVIYRFDRDHLQFGSDPGDVDDELGVEREMVDTLAMPNVKKFAPHVSLKPDLFDPRKKPPIELLMRTILRGGRLTTRPYGGWSKINRFGQVDDPNPYVGQFAGFSTWSRPVEANQLVLRIRSVEDNSIKDTIRLEPREPGGTIRLKIANLCAENPLEWSELFLRAVTDKPDNDFRWFYSLWKHDSGQSFEKLVAQPKPHLLPVPQPIPAHGEVSNCTGSQLTVASVGGH